MISVKDKEKAQSWVQKQSEFMKMQLDESQSEELMAFLKHLSNVMDLVQPHFIESSIVNQTKLSTKEEITNWFEELCEQIILAGEGTSFRKEYKTSDVATFMGVTVATVNNWIKENRIRGTIKEGKYAHARIPETAIYLTQSNEPMTIKEIAKLYYSEKEQHTSQTQNEDELLVDLKYFNQKYGGTFFETLAIKETLTPQEQRDALEWKYVLKRLGRHE